MRTWNIAAAAVALAWVSAAQEDDGIAWRTDLEKARAEAAETGRPLLVVFR